MNVKFIKRVSCSRVSSRSKADSFEIAAGSSRCSSLNCIDKENQFSPSSARDELCPWLAAPTEPTLHLFVPLGGHIEVVANTLSAGSIDVEGGMRQLVKG